MGRVVPITVSPSGKALQLLEPYEDDDERCQLLRGSFPSTNRERCPTSDSILESLSLPQRRCLGTLPQKSA
jgi:hypothetical protein